MPDRSSHEFAGPIRHTAPEGPEAMQAFVARHHAFFILLAVLVGQLLLLSLQITRNRNVRLFQVWAVNALDPFERSLHWALGGTARSWRAYRGLWHAQQENQELRAQLEAADTQIRQLSARAGEADRLRNLLDFKTRLSFQTVPAEVIASSPGERSNAVFIDKGTSSGLTSDLGVITPAGVVGKIIAVFPHTAQVLLLTDPLSGVGCMLEQSRVQGVLKGAGRNSAQLNYVMNGQQVSPGEAVLTSGLDQIYPKGLPVGTVAKAFDGNIYRNIEVKPSAALDRLETVLVVLKPPPTDQPAPSSPAHP